MATDPVNNLLRDVARVATRKTRNLGRPPDIGELTRSLQATPDFDPAAVFLPTEWRETPPDLWLQRILASDVWNRVAEASEVHLIHPRDSYWVRAVEVRAPPCLVYRSGRDLTYVDWVGTPFRSTPRRRADEYTLLLGLYLVRRWGVNPARTKTEGRLELAHRERSLRRPFLWWHVRKAEDLATCRAVAELGPRPTSYELTV